MADTPRGQLLRCMRVAASDKTASEAIAAHRRFGLRAPTIDEIANCRISNDVNAVAAGRCVESLLNLRQMPATNKLPKERQGFQNEVLSCITSAVSPADKRAAKEFDDIAAGMARKIAFYYTDQKGKRPSALGEELRIALPHLAGYLLAELELYLEAKFAAPGRNLKKASVFDVQEKLDMLEAHPDEVVRNNSRTIVCAALLRGNLAIADDLASGAKAKLETLAAHPCEAVRRNAGIIVCGSLARGDLAVADELAAGAEEKMKMLKAHPHEAVRRNARSILGSALNERRLSLADELASGAEKKMDMLEAHPQEVVRNNAATILHGAIGRGDLSVADDVAAGAKDKFVMLQKHPDRVVRDYAKAILGAALSRGDLAVADKLAAGAKAKLARLEEHRDWRVRTQARNLLYNALGNGTFASLEKYF